jgi:DNA processing protein
MTSVSPEERKYWIAFSRIARIGSVRAGLLDAHFSSMEEAWKASAGELMAAGLDRGTVTSIVTSRASIDPDTELANLQKTGVKAYCWRDDEYPARLKEVDDKPPVLYVRGGLVPEDEWAIAVVGTRRATPYGRQAAEHFATDLARHKITIVSGLARGIDAVAHRAALASGGRTIAVMACGLDLVYPPEHAKLAQEIMQNGCLVSDYPLGTQPRSEYFPRRNRILSAISLGVLVVEGDIDSGALITARIALDQNREVFAVPGSIYSPTYRGANKLIQEGEAKLVADARDILEELNLTMATHQMELREVLPADPTEARLLKVITNQPIHIDDVQRASGLPISTVSGALAMLELKGIVKQIGPMNFVRTHSVQPRETGTAHSTSN